MPRATGSVFLKINSISHKTDSISQEIRSVSQASASVFDSTDSVSQEIRSLSQERKPVSQVRAFVSQSTKSVSHARGAIAWVMGSAGRPSGPAPPVRAAKHCIKPEIIDLCAQRSAIPGLSTDEIPSPHGSVSVCEGKYPQSSVILKESVPKEVAAQESDYPCALQLRPQDAWDLYDKSHCGNSHLRGEHRLSRGSRGSPNRYDSGGRDS